MIRPKSEESEPRKSTQEMKEEAPPAKAHNHHSIDAILGRPQAKHQIHKPGAHQDASDDEEDHVSDTELSSSETKSGLKNTPYQMIILKTNSTDFPT